MPEALHAHARRAIGAKADAVAAHWRHAIVEEWFVKWCFDLAFAMIRHLKTVLMS